MLNARFLLFLEREKIALVCSVKWSYLQWSVVLEGDSEGTLLPSAEAC